MSPQMPSAVLYRAKSETIKCVFLLHYFWIFFQTDHDEGGEQPHASLLVVSLLKGPETENSYREIVSTGQYTLLPA